MAAVYRTYIDCSELIPAFVFAFALLWLPIGMVFVILSLGLAVIGWICLALPAEVAVAGLRRFVYAIVRSTTVPDGAKLTLMQFT